MHKRKVHKTTHIMTGDLFEGVYNFMVSIKNASEETKPSIMKRCPHKIAYEWIKKYDLLKGETSSILIFKQTEGTALDSCLKVVQYSKMFNVICDIHKL